MSESVAQDIVRDIVDRGLGFGDRLPAEAAMLEQYGVSRESLREALRILEVQGLISIRRGPGGGPSVSGIDPRDLARTSSLYFHLAGATYEELFETWLATEPLLTEKVARSGDRAAVRTALAPFLEDFEPDVEQGHLVSTANAFHAVIAELSHNRVLTLLIQAVSHIVNDQVLNDFDPRAVAHLIGNDHDRIARAITDGRASKAKKLMEDHIVHICDAYRSAHPGRMHDQLEWR
jgi:DNA-binding FadR family transcriptional regulator